MAYSLHLVPSRRSTEITVALGNGDAFASPTCQSRWPNWVKLLSALEPYLEPDQRRTVHSGLAAGKAVWLPAVYFSDAELDKLGF